MKKKFAPKPSWIKVRPPAGPTFNRLSGMLKARNLTTVCEEARCPNIAECWGGGTATLMLMGDTCTRGCRFCAVNTGNPKGVLDPFEPIKAAETVELMNLNYVVITSVDRDDLIDGGAAHFAKTIETVHARCPDVLVEVLIPDFQGNDDSLEKVIAAKPEVLAHNVETVERLTRTVRDQRAGYRLSLDLLDKVKVKAPAQWTKTSIMIGLGETRDELRKAFSDLRDVGVDFLTLGQYLQPTKKHLPVTEFVKPEIFDELKDEAMSFGFRYVASGPLVRSSYRAGEFYMESIIRNSTPAATTFNKESSWPA